MREEREKCIDFHVPRWIPCGRSGRHDRIKHFHLKFSEHYLHGINNMLMHCNVSSWSGIVRERSLLSPSLSRLFSAHMHTSDTLEKWMRGSGVGRRPWGFTMQFDRRQYVCNRSGTLLASIDAVNFQRAALQVATRETMQKKLVSSRTSLNKFPDIIVFAREHTQSIYLTYLYAVNVLRK